MASIVCVCELQYVPHYRNILPFSFLELIRERDRKGVEGREGGEGEDIKYKGVVKWRVQC